MRRTVTEDKGYVPDYEFSQRDFKRRLGITERDNVWDVDIRGDRITMTVRPLRSDEKIIYETDQREFKEKLGITEGRSVIMVLASVWSSKVQISLYKNRQE